MFLPVITKKLNREILTRTELPLKGGMGLKLKKFNIIRVHWKILFFGGGRGSQINQYIGGNCLKRWSWTVYRFKGGGQWTLCRSLALTRLFS